MSLVALLGGEYLQGADDPDGHPADGEGPVRRVRLDPFRMATTAVTNAEYGSFVKATGYRTEAERLGWSYVFSGFVRRRALGTAAGTSWWLAVPGSCWSNPEGPGSDVSRRQHHPVVHVTHADAVAYCAWAGTRLPTEAEWEFAARGGLEQRRFPWGDELTPRGGHRCNIWQGTFPVRNTGADGHLGTAPVKSYRPNGYGLYNMAGNVWEWCADWFGTEHPRDEPIVNPTGPPTGEARVLRGGSYLCHASYCNRYRVAARTSSAPDTSAGNTGFRVAV